MTLRTLFSLTLVFFAGACGYYANPPGTLSDYCYDDYTRKARPTQVNWVLEFGPTSMSELPSCDGSDLPMDHP